jgi:hypothetical protein
MAIMEDPETKVAAGNSADATLQQFGYEQGLQENLSSIR